MNYVNYYIIHMIVHNCRYHTQQLDFILVEQYPFIPDPDPYQPLLMYLSDGI